MTMKLNASKIDTAAKTLGLTVYRYDYQDEVYLSVYTKSDLRVGIFVVSEKHIRHMRDTFDMLPKTDFTVKEVLRFLVKSTLIPTNRKQA